MEVTDSRPKLRFAVAYFVPVAVYAWLLALWAVLVLLLPAVSFTAARFAVLGWLFLVVVVGVTTGHAVRRLSPLAIVVLIVWTGLTGGLTTLWLGIVSGGLAALVYLLNVFKTAVDWRLAFSGSGTLTDRHALDLRHALLIVVEALCVAAALALV